MRSGRLAFSALALVGSVALAACSGSSTKRSSTSAGAAVTTTIARTTTTGAPTITMRLTRVKSQSVLVRGGRADAGALRRAQAVVDAYIRGATQDALLRGGQPRAVATLFVSDLGPKVRANSGGALADSGVGRLRLPTTLAGTTRLIALVDGTGRTGAITATVHVRVSAITTKGRWRLQRDAELLLLPVGPTWRIAAYDLTLRRTNLATQTTTTSTTSIASTTTTTAGAKP